MIDILGFIHWSANPDIFHIGNLSIRWYGLLFASGLLIGYYIGEWMLKSEGVQPKWIESLFFYIIIATIVGARLGHVFFYGWDYYSQNPADIIKVWHGGLASHGGAIGIMIAMYIHSRLVTKRTVLWTLDRIVVPTALVAVMIRMGNLMNSEIYGVQTDLPWGFVFNLNGEVLPKHPTQIYEALAYLISFAYLMFLYKKTTAKNRPGLLLGVFFILIFTARFFIEFIKEDQEAFEAGMLLNMGQWLSVPFILGGIFLVVRAKKLPEKVFKNK
jgi:phosphatidylglycerol---prolipoprotein diacylglyceryl transferase